MDDAAGDLKQALPNVCDSAQIHVEVHQKSSRSLIGALFAVTCACFLSASFHAPPRARRTQLCLLCALPGVSSSLSLPKFEQIHFSQSHIVGRVIHKLLAAFWVCPSSSLSLLCSCSQLLPVLQISKPVDGNSCSP